MYSLKKLMIINSLEINKEIDLFQIMLTESSKKQIQKEVLNSVAGTLRKELERAEVKFRCLAEEEEVDPWALVQTDYFDESKGQWCVDAWSGYIDRDSEEYDEDDDEGHVVAYVDPDTYVVTYVEESAEDSKNVQEAIADLIRDLKSQEKEDDFDI